MNSEYPEEIIIDMPQAKFGYTPKEILTVRGGDPPPQDWLDIHNIGRFRKPNAWHRFWAWFLLGWRWDERLWRDAAAASEEQNE